MRNLPKLSEADLIHTSQLTDAGGPGPIGPFALGLADCFSASVGSA